MYAVKAYNALGMAQTKAKLTVLNDEHKQLEPHFVLALPRDVVVVAGEPALLAVQVAGQPPPDVLWFRVRLPILLDSSLKDDCPIDASRAVQYSTVQYNSIE